MIGSYEHITANKNHTKRPIPYRCIDKDLFSQNIGQILPPTADGSDADTLLDNVTNTLYTCAAKSKRTVTNHYENAAKPANR